MSDEGKIRAKIAAVVVAVLGLAMAAGFLGLPAYRHLKEKRSAAAAQFFFDRGDFRSAWLSAREALLVNSNNLAACGVMAGVADAAHSPATLDWCERVVKLSPTVTNQLRLAVAGLRYQSPPYPLTSQILGELSNAAAALPDFHVVAAEMDLNLHRMAEAEDEFAEACKLEPTNRLLQFNLDVIRLGSTNALAAADARAQLEKFFADTNLAPQAWRSLAAERLLHDDAAGALAYSTRLLAGAPGNLNDRLQHLGILKRLQSPELAAQLTAVQLDTATNATAAAQTASWMEANGFLPQTADWLNTLPADVKAQTPVQLAMVDYYLGTTNWQGLCEFAAKGDWGEMNFLRLAFLSRAWGRLGEPLVADADWNSAVNLAGNQLGALNALLQLASRWEMKAEQENLLRRISQQFPDAGWAQHDLEILYLADGNTSGLYELYLKQLPRAPQNALLKNNLAATALLLKTNLTQAGEWVTEAYAQSPENPDVVSTYAYALHLQGRDKDGLAALEKLAPAQLEEPAVALYYGILLSAAGDHDKAARFFAIAEKNGRLLPEEKKLLAKTGKAELVH